MCWRLDWWRASVRHVAWHQVRSYATTAPIVAARIVVMSTPLRMISPKPAAARPSKASTTNHAQSGGASAGSARLSRSGTVAAVRFHCCSVFDKPDGVADRPYQHDFHRAEPQSELLFQIKQELHMRQ